MIDPRIALGVNPPQIANALAIPSPIEQYAQVAQLQNALTAGRLHDVQANKAIREEAANTAVAERMRRPDYATLTPAQQQQELLNVGGPTALPLIKAGLDVAHSQAQTDTARLALAEKRRVLSVSAIATANTPAELVQNSKALLDQGLVTPDQHQATVDQITNGTISDANFKDFKMKVLPGMLSPEQQYTAAQPEVKTVQTPQGTIFANMKQSAGPIGQIPGTPTYDPMPKIVANDTGVFAVNPSGMSGWRVPATGGQPGVMPAPAARPTPAPQPAQTDQQRAQEFQGNLNERIALLQQQANDPNLGPATRAQMQANLAATQQAAQQAATQPFGSSIQQAKAAPTSVPVPEGQAPKALGAKDFMAPEDAKNVGKYIETLNSNVQAGHSLLSQVDEFRNAMKNYQTGPGAETRLALAKAASAMGLPKSVVEGINRGSIADAQEIQKMTAQMAMQSLKSAMEGQGRIAQAEFKVFAANNPNLSLDPGAIEKIFNFANRQYQRSYAEQQALDQYRSQGGDVARWPAVWSKTLNDQGIVQPSVVTGAAKGTEGAKSATTPRAPAIGTIEQGHRFKGGDPANPANWEKV